MLTRIPFNLAHVGVEIRASKVRRVNSNRLCREAVRSLRSLVTVEFVQSQFAPTRVNIIPCSFIHCQAKLGKLR